MKPFLSFLWRHRIYGALSFLGMLALLGCLYMLASQNPGDVPFFYTTR